MIEKIKAAVQALVEIVKALIRLMLWILLLAAIIGLPTTYGLNRPLFWKIINGVNVFAEDVDEGTKETQERIEKKSEQLKKINPAKP